MRSLLAGVILCLMPLAVQAEDRLVRLYAPPGLTDTGVLAHILPRFSLKTQVRVKIVPKADADMVLGDQGQALFKGAGQVWHMQIRSADHPGTQRLADWLGSDVGRNTVTGFAPEGTALFTPYAPAAVAAQPVEVTGDAVLGLAVSRRACARCHAVETGRTLSGIGSTPSFAVLRAFPDWEARFVGFYALNPHPAFTIVPEVTEPFPVERPSPIVPITLTLDELDALLAYVAGMAAADLGAPLAQN